MRKCSDERQYKEHKEWVTQKKIHARERWLRVVLHTEEIPRENSKGTHNRAVMRDHGHNFASKRLTLARRCERHQNSGLSILAAAIEAVIRSAIGPNPPPTRRRMMESRIRTTAPYFF